MADKSITKVSSSYAPKGPAGQKYLASGIQLSMRLWEKENPAEGPKIYRWLREHLPGARGSNFAERNNKCP